jgi:hypothetical protein
LTGLTLKISDRRSVGKPYTSSQLKNLRQTVVRATRAREVMGRATSEFNFAGDIIDEIRHELAGH